MGAIASQITSLTIVLSTVYSDADKKTSKLCVTGLCAGKSPGPVNSPHKWPVTRKIFSFDDVIMYLSYHQQRLPEIKAWASTLSHIKDFLAKLTLLIPPHWHDTGSWNPSSSKIITYLFYIVNIMDADVLATQPAFMIMTMLNRINSVLARAGLNNYVSPVYVDIITYPCHNVNASLAGLSQLRDAPARFMQLCFSLG